jgi:hypothetical protein
LAARTSRLLLLARPARLLLSVKRSSVSKEGVVWRAAGSKLCCLSREMYHSYLVCNAGHFMLSSCSVGSFNALKPKKERKIYPADEAVQYCQEATGLSTDEVARRYS